MPASPSEIASRRGAAPPVSRTVGPAPGRSARCGIRPAYRHHQIGTQQLRVGIRPLALVNGPATAGPPTLLINGIGVNMELADPPLSELDADETVIFDLASTGGSPPPMCPYRLFTMARLGHKLLDQLG